MRAEDQAGEEAWLILEVPKGGGGVIYSSVPKRQSVLRHRPEDVEKIRQALAEARAQALQDRERG